MAEQTDLGPATQGLAAKRQERAVMLVRDVMAGTQRLRDKKKEYLPQFTKEADPVYAARVRNAALFNGTRRTLQAFAGMIFRRPTAQHEIHTQIEPHLDNIDLTGRDLDTFAKDHFTDAGADGHAGIFVDMQPPVEADSLDEERQAGNRPYWINIPKQSILDFDTESVGGRTVLTYLRYRETVTGRSGRWLSVEIDRVREYWLERRSDTNRVQARFRVWQLDPDKEWPGEGEEDWTVVAGEGSGQAGNDLGWMSISRIPLAVTYTGQTAYLESDPPFEDMAELNIRHFKNDADNQNLATTVKVQTLFVSGEKQENVEVMAIGPGNAVVSENPDADMKWVSADGSSFEVFLEELDRVERRMAMMGLSMLATDQRANMSEGSKRIDKAESDSQLAGMAKNLDRALNEALGYHAEWMEIEEPGTLSVNKDFETDPLDSATFRELRELWAERGISWETLIKSLMQGDLLPDGFDPDEERLRIAEEDVVRLDAAEQALSGAA